MTRLTIALLAALCLFAWTLLLMNACGLGGPK